MSNKATVINEMREFAGFTPREQRYIKRSLEVALRSDDLESIFSNWVREISEQAEIINQYKLYREMLPNLKASIPKNTNVLEIGEFLGELTKISAFDLNRNQIQTFSAYRYLYERILGASVRPWLPSTFCAAAALPIIDPPRRKLLLHSISEAAATAPGWSPIEPVFFPEYIDKNEY